MPWKTPWDQLAQREDILVEFKQLTKQLARSNGIDRIQIDSRIGQISQRCALQHEIIHIERHDTCACDPKAERAVRLEAARRLVPFETLCAACRQGEDRAEIASTCDVTRAVLKDRFAALTRAERKDLLACTEHLRQWA